MGCTPHTATYRGKRVRVVLRDGTVFVDRFVTRTPGKVCVFDTQGRIPASQIKAFSPYRPLQEVSTHKK